ncbi:TetR/AcrR family transcriptional regulator [Sabulicella glaciei]|uniref:TetR/AcrR family transcriptional regulator n=1 Tax=Sabulicella glaciei TaxID=2984948 RepID=A0ABT3NPY9_9PROT|nr:TetR/AcrR family transcriptional regulator [Roseococcus sp. MDT2-1-1]MCW8084217.1 TetR/AcrR family transcriptional regulator [Roseococcus sp. MDT2-1-1]
MLDAAFEEFAAHGYAGAKMTAVAQRAGVAKGLVYHYYPSKEALFRAVMQACLEPVFAEAEREATDEDVPATVMLERLLDLAYAEREGQERQCILFRLIVAEGQRFPELSAWYEEAVFRRAVAIARAVLRHGARRGEFDAALAEQEGMAEVLLAPAIMNEVWRMMLGEGRAPSRAGMHAAQAALLARALAPGGMDARGGGRDAGGKEGNAACPATRRATSAP